MINKHILLFFLTLNGVILYTAPAQSSLIILNTDQLSLIFQVNEDGKLLLPYFGQLLSDPAPMLSRNVYQHLDYSVNHEAFPVGGGKNFREPALLITHSDGDLNTELEYVKHERTTIDDNSEEIIIYLEDTKFSIGVKLFYKSFKREDVFVTYTEIINDEQKEITLHNYYSFYLPVYSNRYYLTHFHGSAANEMSVKETLLTPGMKSIQSRKGIRTTHTENPSFLLSLETPLQENSGEVIAGALAWSGNYKLNFELDEFNSLYISAGINPYASEYHLSAGGTFTTPEMIFTFSSNGAGDISRNFHDWARRSGMHNPEMIRPIVLNSWEGVYFSFDEPTLKKMIDDASRLGIEIFVLDDGWFGNNYPRDNAKMGLGDWQVNKKKLPNGIGTVADYAVEKGMKFGIWIEPEMVNPESDLAKKHPDWIVKADGRDIPTIRNQWLLDLTKPEVQDFVFQTFEDVLSLSKNISYIKWDANRHVQSVGSDYLPDDRQSHFWVEYTRGLYDVYERIRKKYPNIIVQACSSGGGRVDYGALKFNDEFWVSDNTDAYSRAFMQYATNLIYPAIATGAHVSHVPNRHTRRIIPLKFRIDMAMTGRMGYELQPKDLGEEDFNLSKESIKNYKEHRDIIQEGDLFRITSPYDSSGYYSLMYVSKDKKRALFFVFCMKYQGFTINPEFRLNGLDASKEYLIKEINREKVSSFWGNGMIINGDYLAKVGINPDLRTSYDSMVLYLESKQ